MTYCRHAQHGLHRRWVLAVCLAESLLGLLEIPHAQGRPAPRHGIGVGAGHPILHGGASEHKIGTGNKGKEGKARPQDQGWVETGSLHEDLGR